jgi:hypothetical protein
MSDRLNIWLVKYSFELHPGTKELKDGEELVITTEDSVSDVAAELGKMLAFRPLTVSEAKWLGSAPAPDMPGPCTPSNCQYRDELRVLREIANHGDWPEGGRLFSNCSDDAKAIAKKLLEVPVAQYGEKKP